MTEEFSQMVMARVGFNSAVQGRADLPEGTTKLVIIFPKSGSNRSEKKLQKIADRLFHDKIGTLLMDLWDEEEGGNPVIETSKTFLENRIKEILAWVENYKAFRDLKFILVGVDRSGEVLEPLKKRYDILKVLDSEDSNDILKKIKRISDA